MFAHHCATSPTGTKICSWPTQAANGQKVQKNISKQISCFYEFCHVRDCKVMTAAEILTVHKVSEILQKIENTQDVSVSKLVLGAATEKGKNMVGEVVAVDLEATIQEEKKVTNVLNWRM